MLHWEQFNLYKLPRRFALVGTLCGAAVVLMGCAGGSNANSTGSTGGGTTTVNVIASSDANDQVTVFDLGFESINLISKSGASVSILPQKEHVEFMHLNGLREPVATATVPSDTYTSANIVIGPADFACYGRSSTDGTSTQVYFYGFAPASSDQDGQAGRFYC